MPAKKFRFVSPGVQVKEIDRSQIPALPGAVGPVVIGRTLRGPGMVPVTVRNYEQFVEKFGAPDRGAGSSDVWRNGNTTAPTYASYAAEAYLRNSSPLTMVRLMGTQDDNAATGLGEAGWKAAGGAWGLFVLPNEKEPVESSKQVYQVSSSASGSQELTISLSQKLISNVDKSVVFTAAESADVTLTTSSAGNTLTVNGFYSGSNGTSGSTLAEINTEISSFDSNITASFSVGGNTVAVGDLANYSLTGSGLTLTAPPVTFEVDGGTKLVTGSLAAVFYLNENSTIEMVGTTGSTDTTSGSNVMVQNKGADYEFRAKIDSEEYAFNFNKNSAKYIRKVFNTNPTLANAEITDEDSLKKYWLGESFETFLREKVQNESAGNLLGFVARLSSGSIDAGDFKGKQADPGVSGWVIGQDLNPLSSSYKAHQMPKLFRFVASEGQGGDWEQNNVKVSIFDIKAPVNEYQKYGTFSVGIRKLHDVDSNPEFVEVFTGCNLDPTSPNYIAAKIGDRHLKWDTDEKRHVELGEYPNRSRYVRVEVNSTIEQGGLEPELLPFGFFGPPRFKTATDFTSGSANTDSMINGAVGGKSTLQLTASLEFPRMKLRGDAADAGTLDLDQAYFGVVANEGTVTPVPRIDEDYRDLARAKPADVKSDVITTGTSEYSFVFSLDDVVVTGSSTTGRTVTWASGSRLAGTSLTSLTSGSKDWTSLTNGVPATALADKSYKDLLELGFDKFTMPLFGGTDGLDLTEREPFRNTLTDGKTAKQSYAVNSLYRAIDSIREPEVLNMNLLVLPGITNRAVTKYAIDMCEKRADALAIIDIENGYVPSSEGTDAESDRVGSVKQTITSLKNRNLNTSYACTYYPWVKVLDTQSGQPVWMPPSVVALGTMASSQENSEVWFAPAGFNRGGLSVGSSGLSVVGVREKLTAKQRDSLYEVNINPIASFPSEGIVIFGQKTLQAVPSALDRINVRRLVLFLKKQISIISAGLLFEPNVEDTWNRFRRPVTSILNSVKSRNGISDFRLVLDSTTTTAEEIDRNMMYAKLFIKPVYAIEFIGIDFVITNTGASFEDL
jgi:hypothetical protein